jgi:hypothetical protein
MKKIIAVLMILGLLAGFGCSAKQIQQVTDIAAAIVAQADKLLPIVQGLIPGLVELTGVKELEAYALIALEKAQQAKALLEKLKAGLVPPDQAQATVDKANQLILEAQAQGVALQSKVLTMNRTLQKENLLLRK